MSDHLLTNALTYLDAVEAALDRQIYPQQRSHDFDAPDDAEYHVVLTAKQWRQLGAGVTLLQTLSRS